MTAVILLKRVRLINWHNFVNDCINIENITYIIGLSGVGKTTIMDAVRYCLTTNKNFNSIGNKNSSRTLQGSIHGKQHTGGFSRPEHTVSYIGCEFADTENEKFFVICVRIDSESPYTELGRIDQDWYISSPGVSLDNIPFIDSATNTPSEKANFKLPDGKLKGCTSQKDARNRICMMLGIGRDKDAEKFLSVFHMGTSLEGLSDIREFIYAYILPEPEVDPNFLDQDRQKLEKMQDVLNSSMLKKELLDEIESAFKAAFEKKKDVDINSGYIRLAEFMSAEEAIFLCRQKIEEQTYKSERYTSQLNELKIARDDMHEKLIEAKKNKDNSDEAQKLDYYTQKIEELSKKYNAELENNKIFRATLEKLNFVCEKICALGINIAGSPFSDSESEEYYINAGSALSECGDKISAMQRDCYLESAEISQKLKEINKKLDALNSGKFIYPNNNQAERVKKMINAALTDAGMEPDAKIFCELLQMTDDKWQNAVEVCLGRRRFDIIVSDSHYKIAKSAMIRNDKLCRGISLVDTPALIADEKEISFPDEDELAYKVNSENRFARLYLNTLLYEIKCCENSDDIEKYKKSITPDCIRHTFYRTEFVNYTELFIGINARKKQLEEAKQEQLSLQKAEKNYTEKVALIDDALKKYNNAVNSSLLTDLRELCGSFARSEEIYKEYEEVKKQADELRDNPILAELLDLVEKYGSEYSHIDKEIGEINKKLGVSEDLIRDNENKIGDLQRESLEKEEAFDNFCEKFPLLVDIVKGKYEDGSRLKAAREIVKNQKDYHRWLESAYERVLKDTLIPLQRQYNSKYTTDFSEGIESFSDFDNLYNTLVNIELEKNIESLRIAKERCKERFRDEILFRLKDDISNARKQFRKLNAILSQFNYGEESYYFEMDRTSNSELGIFYDVIISGNNTEVDLFNVNEIDVETYDIQIQDLMNKIMADVNEASKARLSGEKFSEKAWSKYTDYRTYLDYDVRVINNVTKDYTYLSDVSGEGSGGETQAPFYVAICASLLQIYNQSKNSIRLVLLDEAFSHMTSDRIRPIIKMFKEMQLQVILISTAEKCTEIQPFCDIVHSVVRKGVRNAVSAFERKSSEIGLQ